MALTLGTNSGFVWTAPTADPAGADTVIDGASVVTKHTSPAGATKIVEIGWYRGSGTNTANFEIALYAADGATVPGEAGTRLFVDATNSSSSSGWIVTTVDCSISENTVYWLALQMDAHSGTSNVDTATSGGAGYDRRTSQTALNDPYGGGALDSTTGMYAIYALVLAGKSWTHPVSGLEVHFAVKTIERWLYRAREERDDPVGALRRAVRKDCGTVSLQAALRERLTNTALTRTGPISCTSTT